MGETLPGVTHNSDASVSRLETPGFEIAANTWVESTGAGVEDWLVEPIAALAAFAPCKNVDVAFAIT
jgi:hypothetical protein